MYTTKAHPRACGENFGFDSRCPFDAGSSPRVRGKLKSEAEITTKVRLIPARAGKTAFVAWRCDVRQAHPRACGENRLSLVRAPPLSGSSPRVRGKLGAGAPGCGGAGLIPARAGKTVVPFLGLVSSAAHPRACGENGTCVKPPGRMSGSSPRVRGKLSTSQATISREGLIPARAGKTHVDDTNPEVAGAHPRACGENGDTLETVASQYGSSPRVRGKPPPVGAQRRRRGLIPARAGKTDCRGRPGLCRWAHPRACGENDLGLASGVRGEGSSPRVRGKLPRHRHQHRQGRLIPARAGKTCAAAFRWACRGAHPRACGENTRRCASRSRSTGSSPRVRGKRPGRRSMPPRCGLIPARAGKTCGAHAAYGPPAAHPRACGENSNALVAREVSHGSSPRVRGKPGAGRRGRRSRGLIPARAGKTRRETTRARR